MRTGRFFLGLILGVSVLAAGCGSPRETVSVTERPDTTAEEIDSAPTQIADVVSVPSRYDTVQAQAFDSGKLWPIEDLPTSYFREQYGVTPTEEWRTHLQRATLRFGENCSAAFVSDRGLVMTNHHCAREFVTQVNEGDALLENGFYADSTGDERRPSGLFVDQLVNVEDVTSQIANPSSRRARQMSRQLRISQLENEMTAEAKQDDERLRVNIVGLYRGGTYTAYTYRRYDDVRLAFVPEQALGFFGGEPDNFTYPRHTLDVAFFRVYKQGKPLTPQYYFQWDTEGADVGEPVFAAGNPGSTSRHGLPSQFRYQRDYQLPGRLEVLRSLRNVFGDYVSENPEEAVQFGVQNTYFSLQNSIKSLKGELRGLQDPYLLARRSVAVQALQDSIKSIDSLRAFGQVVREVQQLQQSKRSLTSRNRAFITFANTQLGSRILSRSLHGYYSNFLRERGVPQTRVQSLQEDAREIADWPDSLEQSVLAAQLKRIRREYGADHPSLERLFAGQSADELASQLVSESVVTDGDAFDKLLNEGFMQSNDPAVRVMNALAPLYLNTTRQLNDFQTTEDELNRRLLRAQRLVYERPIAPDATFSLRVSDGRVRGYQHHGTSIPAFTNYYGLYDKYYSYGQSDWTLPQQWITPPDSFDVGTPLNLVSTNDISGGSSGSPLLNRDLELVGVVFDSNMEALPNEYLYRTKGARAISVDVRGILEALDHVYEADRLVEEVTSTPRTAEVD